MKNNIPISNEIPKSVFPDFEIIKYSDKLDVYFLEDLSQDLFSCKIVNKAGSIFDEIPGTSYLTHMLLSYGTKNKNYEQISYEQDIIGARMSSQCNFDEGGLNIVSLYENSSKALDILFDCYLEPVFDEKELNRTKKKVISSIKQAKVDPGYLAHFANMQLYFKDHPYANPSFGFENTIETIQRTDIDDFYHNKLLNAKHAVIISGQFNRKEIDEKLKLLSNRLSNNELNFERKFDYPQTTQCAVIDKKGAAQANLIIASEGISTEDKMLPQAKIANIIFGGFFMSRLNEVLREKYGFTYGIHSNFTHRRYANTLNISSGLNTVNLKKAIDLINEIKQDYASKPVTEEEFTRAVRYYTGNFNVNLETHLHISGLLKSIFLYNLNKTHYTDLLSRIRNISIDDVYEVQNKYFNSEGTVIAASGEIEKIKEQIEGYGDIEEIVA